MLVCVNEGASNVHVTLALVESWTDFHSIAVQARRASWNLTFNCEHLNKSEKAPDSDMTRLGVASTFGRRGNTNIFHRRRVLELLSVCLRRFLRERRACSRSPVCRATQTIASVWAPAGAARIRVRNFAGRWAPPPCSRCVARRRHHRGSCAPWKRAKGPAWSPATSASPRSSCACSRASPSWSPACCSTSSWSEGILNYRIERENHRVYERTEWNQKQTLEIYF